MRIEEELEEEEDDEESESLKIDPTDTEYRPYRPAVGSSFFSYFFLSSFLFLVNSLSSILRCASKATSDECWSFENKEESRGRRREGDLT